MRKKDVEKRRETWSRQLRVTAVVIGIQIDVDKGYQNHENARRGKAFTEERSRSRSADEIGRSSVVLCRHAGKTAH